MIAAAQSISILWIPIIGVPTIAGYIAGVWQRNQEHDEHANRLRRMLRRERQLCDDLADELHRHGLASSDAFQRYLNRRGAK